jgi:N-acetylneuraminic acid mutarotase
MNRLLFIAIFCLISSVRLTAQDKLMFSNLSPMPVPLGATESATDGQNLYIVNGFSTTIKFSRIIEKYDIQNNNWTILTDKLIPKQFPSAEVVGENMYVFNGRDSAGNLNNKVEIVNLKDGKIKTSKKNPEPVYNSGSAVWKNKIYVFGGAANSGKYSNKLFEFDPAKQKWKELAPMPEAMEAQGTFVNGKLYVIGGYNGSPSSRIDMYDVEKNTWIKITTMTKPLSANSVVAKGPLIYTLFDFTNQSSIGVFDTRTNTFKDLQSENMVGRRHAGTEIIDGKIYIFGGNTSSAQMSCLISLQVTEVK